MSDEGNLAHGGNWGGWRKIVQFWIYFGDITDMIC